MIEARRFPTAAVCSPHYLASSTGLAVLETGGNALDAAIAMNLTLGVVAPYHCGYGGDLFALIWRDDLFAFNGSGRAPAAADLEAIRRAVPDGVMPERGPLTVTVPGAPEAWFALLERFGTRSFRDLAGPALRYAREGFPLTELGARAITASSREAFQMGSSAGGGVYERPMKAGDLLQQPKLARTIEALAHGGADAYYRGEIADAIVQQLGSLGGSMTAADLADHRGEWVQPLRATYRNVEVVELPPNTQGIMALEALKIVEACGPLPPDGPDRQHLLIEAVKMALSDRNAYVTDPDRMQIQVSELTSPAWVRERAATFDPSRAGQTLSGQRSEGATAYLSAVDRDEMFVSLIQSNCLGFGSGVSVPDWGINLHNRGMSFSLDPNNANVIAPGKRTLHTLIPAMALKAGKPWLAFGSMGLHGQAQIHVQLVVRLVDDAEDVQHAISAPRWSVSPEDGSVAAENRFEMSTTDGLVARGHALSLLEAFDDEVGHAHAIRADRTCYTVGTDPRTEGAALGF
jgi:gamma-glutamyltranspeptidase/glutathione hydrolase